VSNCTEREENTELAAKRREAVREIAAQGRPSIDEISKKLGFSRRTVIKHIIAAGGRIADAPYFD
jgi:DNA-binding Lrp family transcriptional regulator